LKRALPVSRAAKLRAKENSSAIPATLAALTDGEDFELLFTIASQDAVKLLDAWKNKFPGLKLSCIGKIVTGDGIFIRDHTGSHKLQTHGYVHFA
jgi:thiamine-monophosphate kinase